MPARTVHLLYGMSLELDTARAEVELALDLSLVAHDSSYLGDYYSGELPSGHDITLRRNIDPMHDASQDPPEERFAEPAHSQHCTLLHVDGSDVTEGHASVQAILEKLPGATLLEFKYHPDTMQP